MPDLTPEQALCALMLGTGETQLILDPEVVRAVQGVSIRVEYREKPTTEAGLAIDSGMWVLDFEGMPDRSSLEQTGIRVPDVPSNHRVGATLSEISLPPSIRESIIRHYGSGLGEDHPRRRQAE